MDFLITYTPGLPPSIEWKAGKAALAIRSWRQGGDHIHIVGDCILPPECGDEASTASFLASCARRNAVHELKGFFYLIFQNDAEKRLDVHSSFLQILPVYYRKTAEGALISSSLGALAGAAGRPVEISKKYAVEKLLFHYSFLDRTPFEGVSLMPSCHFLRLAPEGLSVQQAFSIADHYVSSPRSMWGRLGELSDLFIATASPYVPERPFALTLTGGFDGRTMLALARARKADFSTFSYGLPTDPDVVVPKGIGRRLGFEHRGFELGPAYAHERFWDDALSFVRETEGAGNLSRAHYVHTALTLSEDFPFLVSGNFGSELFRSMKYPGVMASPVIFALFSCREKKDFVRFASQASALDYLRREEYAAEIEETIEAAWQYKMSLPSGLTVNQQFYLYMFGEVFRKYFGPEIVMQANYLCHRAPFLDYTFFRELLGSSLAGANNHFRETNPLRRFHGQILYAHVMRKTAPALLGIPLDRGYRPGDLLSPLGIPNIAWQYFAPRLLRRRADDAPAYDAGYYQLNRDKIETLLQGQLRLLNPAFLREKVRQGAWDMGEQDLVNALSMEIFYDK